MMNKFGGINDVPNGWITENPINHRIYRLWFDILRRCNDESQHIRPKGRTYSDCRICNEWMKLSIFADEIKLVPGYEQWVKVKGMELDKDIFGNGEKLYSRKTCCFIPSSVNKAIMNRQNPHQRDACIEANKVRYAIANESERIEFDSEKAACEYLGVKKCSIASCYLKGYKCKGYKIERIGAKMDLEEQGAKEEN